MDAVLREYVVVGAGPAALCAVAKLVAEGGLEAKDLAWIDPVFKMGAFGTSLSSGSSVPGNTDVESYMKVINGIATLIPACRVPEEVWNGFKIAELDKTNRVNTCPIKIASEPLKYIGDKLADLVTKVLDTVDAIESEECQISGKKIWKVLLRSGGALKTKRVVLATGSEPHTLELPIPLRVVDPNTAFISSELNSLIDSEEPEFSAQGRKICFAVVGSSHSAALAVMNIIKRGLPVKQFMNKPYKFATKMVTPDGVPYTQYDNAGLKGDVAAFTRKLMAGKDCLDELNDDEVEHSRLWSYFIGAGEIDPVTIEDCTHSVVCIGYKPCDTLLIDKKPLSKFSHHTLSSALLSGSKPLAGIFGIGIAFPKQVTSPSGESEFAVGVGKFWATIDHSILAYWKQNPSS